MISFYEYECMSVLDIRVCFLDTIALPSRDPSDVQWDECVFQGTMYDSQTSKQGKKKT